MKQSLMAAAVALVALPLTAWSQDKPETASPSSTAESREITLRGCVVPGQEQGTYVLSGVTEVPPPGGSVMPATAHGRRVVFWLDEKEDVLQHANRGVEVRGTFDEFEESEIELKEGEHPEGGLIAEFEGPGEDVKVANSAVAGAIGTSGRSDAEKDDIKTMLVKVDVKDVKAIDYSCSQPASPERQAQ
jgi:hypothetical protein